MAHRQGEKHFPAGLYLLQKELVLPEECQGLLLQQWLQPQVSELALAWQLASELALVWQQVWGLASVWALVLGWAWAQVLWELQWAWAKVNSAGELNACDTPQMYYAWYKYADAIR